MSNKWTGSPENWFVAQLKPKGLKVAQNNLTRQGFGHFTPLRMEQVSARSRLRSEPKPLFPGYIFVSFGLAGNEWRRIGSTRGISRLILNDIRNPRPLHIEFMAALMQRCDESGLLQAPEDLEVGDRVQILSGPFADTISRIERLTPDQRIQVLVDLMGRSVKVQLPANSVRKYEIT